MTGQSRRGAAVQALIWLTGAFGVSAAAAAPTVLEADAAVRLLQRQDEAVLRVGERIVVAGARFCAAGGRSAGMTVQALSRFGTDYRAAAERVLGISAYPTVTAVAAGGAAATAGLRPGDAIVMVGDHAFAAASHTARDGDFDETSAALDRIEAAWADGRARVEVERDGMRRSVELVPRPACRARFDVRAKRSNNASSDGTYVQVSSDLVEEVQGDDELAAILAHELAHNILRHPQRLTGPKPRPRMRDTEIEADRLSVYLLDAAGYPPAAALRFWGRWGRANDWGILSDRSHPGWKERIRTIEAEVATIAAQRADGAQVRAPAQLAPR